MDQKLKVYHYQFCPYSSSVLALLEATKIPYEAVHIDTTKQENETSEFTKINPFQQVPVIVDQDGNTISECNTILRFISRRYDLEDHWYPKDPKKAALVDQCIDWYTNKNCIIIDYCSSITIRDYKVTPEEAKESIKKVLKQIENIFLENQNYLAGDQSSIADIALIPHLIRLRSVKFDYSEFPKFDEYLTRMESNENIQVLLSVWLTHLKEEIVKIKAQYAKEDAKRKKMD